MLSERQDVKFETSMILYYTNQPTSEQQNPLYRKYRITGKFIEKLTVTLSG